MRLVTDSVADLPASFIQKHNIHIVPINIMFGTEEFLSGVAPSHPKAMSNEEFYAKTQTVTDANFPKTSQPTPHQFVEAYEEMIAAGDDEFLTITVSQKLSGTYASAVMAHRELANEATFHLIDSKTGSAAQAYLVMEAARLIEKGADVETIRARLDEVREMTATVFMIDNLEYAVKGGRVSAWRSTVASLLRIKPIMTVKDGEVVEHSKVRSPRKALRYLIDYTHQQMGGRPLRVAIVFGGSRDNGEKLRKMARETLNVREEHFLEMALPIAINMGPGAVALISMPLDE